VNSKTTLEIDQNMTFQYNPSSSASNLLTFMNATSVLHLNSSTLVATTEMTLLNGTMIVDGISELVAQDGTNGFVFGNGNQDNDFACQINSGVLLSLTNGSLSYNNVNAASWNMINVSSLFSLLPGTTLHLFQTLDLGAGQLQLSRFANLIYEPSTMLSGSVNSV
jgi:hypothetical protein